VFDANKKISIKSFSDKLAKSGIALDLKSQMLFFCNAALTTFFVNGETVSFTGDSVELLKILADKRHLMPTDITKKFEQDNSLLRQLYDWYVAGYLTMN
jgi:50S ribosomal protein L16 3-hydroxylase